MTDDQHGAVQATYPDPNRVQAVAGRLADLRRTLSDHGGDNVEIVAVTKGFGVEAVHAAHAVGLLTVGENYAQELVAKATAEPAPNVTWHFIGQLQSNKIADLAPHVGLWQAVDRLKIGQRIARHQPGGRVLVQLRPAEAPSDGPKGGCPAAELPILVDDLRALGLSVDGVMTVGVQGDLDATRRAFELATELSERHDLPIRSFGMSADLAEAIDCGSTMLRVGTALFGPRPPR